MSNPTTQWLLWYDLDLAVDKLIDEWWFKDAVFYDDTYELHVNCTGRLPERFPIHFLDKTWLRITTRYRELRAFGVDVVQGRGFKNQKIFSWSVRKVT